MRTCKAKVQLCTKTQELCKYVFWVFIYEEKFELAGTCLSHVVCDGHKAGEKDMETAESIKSRIMAINNSTNFRHGNMNPSEIEME